MSPFKCMYAYSPPLFPSLDPEIHLPSALALVRRCHRAWRRARLDLLCLVHEYEKWANVHRSQAPAYQPSYRLTTSPCERSVANCPLDSWSLPHPQGHQLCHCLPPLAPLPLSASHVSCVPHQACSVQSSGSPSSASISSSHCGWRSCPASPPPPKAGSQTAKTNKKHRRRSRAGGGGPRRGATARTKKTNNPCNKETED